MARMILCDFDSRINLAVAGLFFSLLLPALPFAYFSFIITMPYLPALPPLHQQPRQVLSFLVPLNLVLLPRLRGYPSFVFLSDVTPHFCPVV